MKPNGGSSATVLVTGGAGYVGCALVPALLNAGYKVRVFDQMFYGDDGIAPFRDRIEVVEGDIRELPAGLLEGMCGVINLAGLSAEPAAEYRPDINHRINATAAVELATRAKAAGVPRFVQASSCSIYDVGAGHPEKDIFHTEDFPVAPFRVYSITKREAEKGILALAGDGFSPVVLRKGSIYGYTRRTRLDLVVNTFVMQALRKGVLVLHNGGETWRPLLDVRDAVRGYITALEAPANLVGGEIFNLTNGNYRISELALRVQHKLRSMGVRCEIQPDYEFRNIRSCQASPAKLMQRLGFKYEHTMESAIEDLVQKMQDGTFHDLDDPVYHNIKWLDFLEEARTRLGIEESIFDLTPDQIRRVRAGAATATAAGSVQ